MGVGRSGPATSTAEARPSQANVHRGWPRSFSTTAPSVTAPGRRPFELTNYANVKKRARLIAKVTEDRYMPPWHPVDGHGKFLDERRLSEVELATLKNWQKSGMAEGRQTSCPSRPSLRATGY